MDGHGDDEDEAVASSSDSSLDDLAPRVHEHFRQLSTILMETNQNLLSFEFMMKQYQQVGVSGSDSLGEVPQKAAGATRSQ